MTSDLTHDQHDDILRLAGAGANGLQLGDGPGEIRTGRALHLALLGFCTITNTAVRPQRAVVTARGQSFAYRSAA